MFRRAASGLQPLQRVSASVISQIIVITTKTESISGCCVSNRDMAESSEALEENQTGISLLETDLLAARRKYLRYSFLFLLESIYFTKCYILHPYS